MKLYLLNAIDLNHFSGEQFKQKQEGREPVTGSRGHVMVTRVGRVLWFVWTVLCAD